MITIGSGWETNTDAVAVQPAASVTVYVCDPAVTVYEPAPLIGAVPPELVTDTVAFPPLQAMGVITDAEADSVHCAVLLKYPVSKLSTKIRSIRRFIVSWYLQYWHKNACTRLCISFSACSETLKSGGFGYKIWSGGSRCLVFFHTFSNLFGPYIVT
jgi:hypothetical protein